MKITKKDLLNLPAPLQHACRCGAKPGQHCLTKEGKPARKMHSYRSEQLCGARFIKQHVADKVQDDRMVCALKKGHRGKHCNAVHDLSWDHGFQVNLEMIR